MIAAVKFEAGKFTGQFIEAWRASGILGWMLGCVWMIYPVAVATVYWPSDAIGFHAWLQGLIIPEYVTLRQMIVGAIFALLSVAALSLLHLCIVCLIYRRCRFYVQFWPVALLLVGIVANAIWVLATGVFDPISALVGFSPVVATVACHGVCERLGAEFVFGPGPKPTYEPGY